MPTSPTQSPPLAVVDGGSGEPYSSSSHFSTTSQSSSSIIIIIIIIASAVIISASTYLLLRLLSKRFRRAFSAAADDVVLRYEAQNSNHQPCHVASANLLDSLPLFSFRSVKTNGGDCAVCLSRFELNDQLRLLPLCCHAFHAACIDKWIVSNQTCPLCRSTVLPSGSDALDKILNRGNIDNNSIADGNRNANGNGNGNGNGGSFRIELGSVSRSRGAAAEAPERALRSYSLGSFEYIVDDCAYEVSSECTTHRRVFSDVNSKDKDSPEDSAAEVSGGRNWLKEYVDRLASISSSTMSIRSSRRFFTGSSRRSEAAVVPEDLESNRVGEEISELFSWVSGI